MRVELKEAYRIYDKEIKVSESTWLQFLLLGVLSVVTFTKESQSGWMEQGKMEKKDVGDEDVNEGSLGSVDRGSRYE
ncbi:hypothetical protein Pmani_007772 [Petrolisthes manimaculis]|uniref:Uncharacterized protein n=1 Tax=Petrolisthes manimaculis TaxID=1843537 RepID=A0AAE1QA72_9EUCA|nr:hypothetical protein Pmani_007772 [Petrolisthes manimaculis]